MSRGGGAYRKRLAERVAAGTHIPKPANTSTTTERKSHYTTPDVVRLVARESGIKHDRVTLLESSEYSDVITATRGRSAVTHQLAPPNDATPWRNSSPSTALYAD
ncbi:MAG: hypothetical protein ABW061_20645 [Polyangiaceae bacterium]